MENLQEALTFYRKKEVNNRFVLGGGSNILFTKNYDGVILKNAMKGISLVKEDVEFYYVKAAAGENWHAFVQYCLAHNYFGLENLSLIPGCVGASPIQNIGAYGVELKDVFFELEAFHLQDFTVQKFSAQECAFGYRESVFKHQFKNTFAILNVTFKLNKKPNLNTSYGAIEQELQKLNLSISPQAVSQAVINIRQSKLPDPKVLGNAGSFFKNPEISSEKYQILQQTYPQMPAYALSSGNYKIPAAWLIEKVGYKGFRNGDAGCNPLQPLVLVNYGYASGKEILQLSENIITSVHNQFGILLEREVNIL